jgi:hypothetical protein
MQVKGLECATSSTYQSPYDLENKAPETSVEQIEGTKEHVPPLSLVSQRTHVPIKHNILPLTHVGDDVFDGEHGGAINPGYVRLRRLVTAFQNSRYVGYGHLNVYTVNGREKNVGPAALVPQMLIKNLDQTLVCSGGDGLE